MNSIDPSFKKQQRPFFVGMGLLVVSIGVWKILKRPDVPPYSLFGVGAFLCALDFAWPRLAGQLFRAWMKFAFVLGTINTYLLIGLVYFALITPISLLMRIFGKPGPLDSRDSQSRKSSWVSLKAEWKNRNYYAPY